MMGFLFSSLTSKLFGGLSIGILIALAVMGWKLHTAQSNLDTAKAKLEIAAAWQADVTQAARDAAHHPKLGSAGVAQQVRYMGQAIDQTREAMARAKATALAAKAEQERRDDRRRKDADHDLAQAVLSDRRNADRFKRANRMPKPKPPSTADRSDDGPTNMPSPAFGPQSTDRAGDAAQLDEEWVAVPASDIDTCTVNTRRLMIGQDWVDEAGR